MADVVRRPRVQRTDDRALNDLQAAAKAIAEAVNQSPLRLEHLPRYSAQVFALDWVALGSMLTRLPVFRAREPAKLLGASFVAAVDLAPDGTNFRQVYLERAQRGSYNATMANSDTTVEGFAENQPHELDLSAGEQDLLLEPGDVVAMTFGGGGTLPAVGAGLLEMYFEKEDP